MSPPPPQDEPEPEPGSGGTGRRGGPLMGLLQIRLQAAERGRSRIEYVVRPEHLRTHGILHGGIAATLLDSALGVAAQGVAPTDHDVVTAQLNVNFLRPAWEGEALIATGEVVHSGARTAVARGEIRTARGVLTATGSATLIFLARPRDGGGYRRLDDPIATPPE